MHSYRHRIIWVRIANNLHRYLHTPTLSRVVSGPFAVSIDHIDESFSKATVGLLAGVQRVIPEVRIRVGSSNAVCASCGAVVDIASDSGVCAVEILRGVIVHIGNLQSSCQQFNP